MPENDLALLISAARRAGEIATKYSGPTAKTWDKPDGAGPVTEADLAVNTMLEDTLRSARPTYGWLSEETEDNTDRLALDATFIIDPIDGTRSFINGSDTWAHSLAIAHNGRVTAAVIYLPLRDKLYTASAGHGAHLNEVPIRPSQRQTLTGAALLAAKPNLDPEHWHDAPPDVERALRPSLAYRLALVAQGEFDAMITLRPSWEWDIAAGDLILRESGAITSDRNGNPLVFNNKHPQVNGVIAAPTLLHTQLKTGLKPSANRPIFVPKVSPPEA